MTDPQFAALAKLLRWRDGPTREAVSLVLTQGLTTPEAARATGLGYQRAHAAVDRALTSIDLALRVNQ